MRLLVTATMVSFGLFAACSDSSGPSGQGTLVFSAASNCPNGIVELSIDKAVKGQYTMAPSATIQSFSVSAGQHTGGARQIGGQGFVWDSLAVIVPANRSVGLRLTC